MIKVRDVKDKIIFEFDKYDYDPFLLIKQILRKEHFSMKQKNELMNIILWDKR